MIVLHTNIEDSELRKAVSDAVKSEIVSLTREAVTDIVRERVENKIKSSLIADDAAIMKEIDKQLKAKIAELTNSILYSSMWVDKGNLNKTIESLIQKEVEKAIAKFLSNFTGVPK